MNQPDKPEEKPISRRDFLVRSAKAGAIIAGAASAGLWLHDSKGPEAPHARTDASVVLPSYASAAAVGKMSIVSGDDRAKTLNLALKSLGGIETFIKTGDRVLVKVNAAFAVSPMLSATTHPQLVSEVARLCFQAGAASVVVADNPINDPESCFALTGIGQAARSAGAKVMLPRESFFKPTTVPGGSLIKDWPLFYAPLEGVNKVIGVAPVKDHHRSGASMAMKNWYGLMGGRRNIFHQNIHDFIAELALMVKPTLVILDGTTAMMTNGPTGGSLSDLKQTNTMIVGTDQVAVDAFGATLLGKTAKDLPFILKAVAAGAGTTDYESLRPVRASVS
ncbi:MAG: DUF362 domain-containing protein [Syntrophobacteraceae bacterium]